MHVCENLTDTISFYSTDPTEYLARTPFLAEWRNTEGQKS